MADAGVADCFAVVASEGGEPVLALVERSAIDDSALSQNVLIDLTKRAANVDFTGVAPAQVIRGNAVSSALRDTLLLGALLTAAETTGAASKCLNSITEYLKTRKQFGKLIGSYQALKHPTVDIRGHGERPLFCVSRCHRVGDEPLIRMLRLRVVWPKWRPTRSWCTPVTARCSSTVDLALPGSVIRHFLFAARSGRSKCMEAQSTTVSAWRLCYWMLR